MYLIFLKVQIKEESRIDMQLFFGYVGLFNISLCWPVALLLHWLGVESLELPGTTEAVVAILINVSIPSVYFYSAVTDPLWGMLRSPDRQMFITLTSDYLYVVAMLKTTPLVVTVGLSLTIPLAMVGDYFLGKPATFQVLVGAVLVTGAFIVVGVENSKKEGDGLLAQADGMGQRARLRLDETISSESQTNPFDP
jgi:solute carrier family 35 protein F5